MNFNKLFLFVSLMLSQCIWCGFSFAADGIRINDLPPRTDKRAGATTGKILGMRGGYSHPYLSVRGEYTDNTYNVGVDEKSNFLTVVSPGIWFASPAVHEVPISITPHNTASGGLRFGVQQKESFNRFQTYLLTGCDYEMYSQNSDLNTLNYHLEGMVQFNLRGGLSLRALDRFSQDQDKLDVNSFTINDVNLSPEGITLSNPSNVRRFKNNLAGAALNWELSEKFTTRIDYARFLLTYDSPTDQWLNRTDNSLNVHLYYDYSAKTSFFAEYRYVNAHYNDEHSGMNPASNDVQGRDNQQDFLYGGINWDATAKISLMAKAGYQDKSYDAETFNDQNTFVFEVLANYRLTEKTALNLTLYKALEESNTFEANGKKTTMLKLNYNQKIYNRFIAVINFGYTHDDYEQNHSDVTDIDIFQQNLPAGRKDNHYSIQPALQYVFLDWLMAEVSYAYDKRDSSLELYDYDTNTIMFSLNLAL